MTHNQIAYNPAVLPPLHPNQEVQNAQAYQQNNVQPQPQVQVGRPPAQHQRQELLHDEINETLVEGR